MSRMIKVTVELPWAGMDNVVEYYELPDGWDEMSPQQQAETLEDYGRTELENTGVGYGASVVDEDGEEVW